jgi:hypothetical protein
MVLLRPKPLSKRLPEAGLRQLRRVWQAWLLLRIRELRDPCRARLH